MQFDSLTKKGDTVTDPVISDVIIQVIATVSGAIVSIGIPIILSKLNKLNKLYTTVFGLQEVSAVDGLANQVKDNAERLDDIEEKQSDICNSLKSIEDKIEYD